MPQEDFGYTGAMPDRSLRHHLDEAITYCVGQKQGGQRLDDFLRERIPRLSRERIHEMIRVRVRLSWAGEAQPDTPVRVGGEVKVGFPPLEEAPLDPRIPAVFEDTDLLAVDKPPGFLVHPTSYCRKNSLTRILERRLGQRRYAVHRLDRATSGLLLLAKEKEAARRLGLDFKLHRVGKEYVALVEGEVGDAKGVIEKPLGRAYFTPQGIRRDVAADPSGGETALTGFLVERRLAGRTLLRLFPRTGRTHQIRVHLASIGHPVVGDRLYGPEGAAASNRLFLHSLALDLEHPREGRRMRLEAPLPEGFAEGS